MKYYTIEEIDEKFGITGVGKQVWKDLYEQWLKLRDTNKNNEGKICYCGHTNKCDCGDPDFETFYENIKNDRIILNDPNNGWSQKEFE